MSNKLSTTDFTSRYEYTIRLTLYDGCPEFEEGSDCDCDEESGTCACAHVPCIVVELLPAGIGSFGESLNFDDMDKAAALYARTAVLVTTEPDGDIAFNSIAGLS